MSVCIHVLVIATQPYAYLTYPPTLDLSSQHNIVLFLLTLLMNSYIDLIPSQFLVVWTYWKMATQVGYNVLFELQSKIISEIAGSVHFFALSLFQNGTISEEKYREILQSKSDTEDHKATMLAMSLLEKVKNYPTSYSKFISILSKANCRDLLSEMTMMYIELDLQFSGIWCSCSW